MTGFAEPSRKRLLTLCETLIHSTAPATSLRPEVIELLELLGSAEGAYRADRRDLSTGETRTDNGLALSPSNAAICGEDFLRTLMFMRGCHSAIADLVQKSPARTVRVLYAGTGPYALLAIPSMLLFGLDQVSYTLIDRHQESIRSVEALLEALGLSNRVESCRLMDIADYRAEPGWTPDLVLMEILQAVLAKEPQVAMARHLLGQAPAALMVPEEIGIDLEAVDIGKEFSVDGSGNSGSDRERVRRRVGRAFSLSAATVRQWADIAGKELPAARLSLPETDGLELMLFTRIRVHGDHCLGDYDSGLTCPRRLDVERAPSAGDTLQFRYLLGDHPGLACRVEPAR